VAGFYAGRGFTVDPEALVLTASTSEAYAMLFKLLCDPGDEVLVPQPSYPLFDLLSRLEGVRPVGYRLEYHGRWVIDRGGLERAMSARCRAVLVVSPNNPTGSFLTADDRDWLVELCAARGLALLIDEVFAEYPLLPGADRAAVVHESRVLTFSLGGLSKSAGLPQMKLAWTVVSGPAHDMRNALARLEVIADTYLSVSTPVQLAADRLLAAGALVRRAIAARLVANLSALRAAVRASPALTLLEPEGGWTAVVRVPALMSEESLVLRALVEHDVIVHPGYFFDFEDEAYLVLSLLPRPESFNLGVGRLFNLAAGAAA
jgi:aspartate/methionine/tyrosine aminotransferase